MRGRAEMDGYQRRTSGGSGTARGRVGTLGGLDQPGGLGGASNSACGTVQISRPLARARSTARSSRASAGPRTARGPTVPGEDRREDDRAMGQGPLRLGPGAGDVRGAEHRVGQDAAGQVGDGPATAARASASPAQARHQAASAETPQPPRLSRRHTIPAGPGQDRQSPR